MELNVSISKLIHAIQRQRETIRFFLLTFLIAFMFRVANRELKSNDTIELNDIEMLCHSNRSMASIEQYLRDVLTKFEIYKSQFFPITRVSLRQRFTQLAEKCRKQNASEQIVSIAMELADHAYKLPERM
jgi:hypothetical protein